MEDRKESRTGSRSIERALDIMLALAEAPTDLGVTALADRVGISKGTVHRILQTLTSRGFVAFDRHSKEYHLSGKALQVGLSVEGRMDLYTEALPLLEKLSLSTGETAALNVVIGMQLLPISQYLGRQYPSKSIRLGMAFPLHAGAVGRVALAFQTDLFITSYLANTHLMSDYPIDDTELLYSKLETIRSNGYDVNLDEHGISVHSLAFPLLNSRNKLIGAIHIFGPPERWTHTEMIAAIPTCQEILEKASARFRYIAPLEDDEEFDGTLTTVGSAGI